MTSKYNDIFYSYLRLYPGKADEIIEIIERTIDENEGENDDYIREMITGALANELN